MRWYTMGFWRKAERKEMTFGEIARMAYDTITIFNCLQEEWRPNYERVTRKLDAQPFNWSYELFYEKLKKNVNKSGKIIFEELGYSIGFFSSLDNKKSCGYSLRIGSKNDMFINAIIVDFPALFDLSDEQNSALIVDIFQRVIMKFEPFWAGVICNSPSYMQENAGFPKEKGKILTGVHWLNYWSSEIISSIGEEKVKTINNAFAKATYSDGILQLQERPINLELEVDQCYKRMIENYLIK